MSEQPAKNAVSPRDQFNGLADADRERIVAAIEQTPPELFVRPFAVAAAQRAGADTKFVEELCYFLAEWFTLLSESPTGYFERIVEFLSDSNGESGKPEQFASLGNQWRRIMGSDATLGVTLKAFNILRRQANAYQKAVTTTEIRPVYLTDATKTPTHAIVLHQLHITYDTENGKQTSHIAIDGRSVAHFIGVLQRALTKEQTLIKDGTYDFLGTGSDAKR